MLNSTSLLLFEKPCNRWEWEYWKSTLTTFFHIPSWPPVTNPSILVLHGSLTSTPPSLLLLPLLLSFTIFLLPKILWSLHQHYGNNKPLTNRYVDAVDEMVEDTSGSAELCYYITSDKWCYEKEDLVADINVAGGEDLLFLSGRLDKEEDSLLPEQATMSTGSSSISTPLPTKEDDDDPIIIDINIEESPSASLEFHTPLTSTTDEDDLIDQQEEEEEEEEEKEEEEEHPLSEEKKALEDVICRAIALEGEKKVGEEQEEARKMQEREEEQLTDTCTNGSTSKSSCEWRGNFRDSETDGFFSSSSRRSSSQWESYVLYRKYDEKMVFFDGISSQKLKETESMRSIKVQPRSFSERIVGKLSSTKKKKSGRSCNPFQDLESAYVAQVCLAWEAISWNYNSFRLRMSTSTTSASERRKEERGCSAQIAQQFQQFLVLLQRFIENEPYEYGRRPEVYARLRLSSPKLLLVPEFRHGEEMREDLSSRIPSTEFLKIMEDIIRTFMTFLKADKRRHWQTLKERFLKRKSSSVDRNMLHFIIKANRKKKAKLKELRRGGNCLRKVKLRMEEEMEILMCIVDMKVVSRVLRMAEISEQQLRWCEEKMRKVRFWNGRVQRDSTPLFFPEQ